MDSISTIMRIAELLEELSQNRNDETTKAFSDMLANLSDAPRVKKVALQLIVNDRNRGIRLKDYLSELDDGTTILLQTEELHGELQVNGEVNFAPDAPESVLSQWEDATIELYHGDEVVCTAVLERKHVAEFQFQCETLIARGITDIRIFSKQMQVLAMDGLDLK